MIKSEVFMRTFDQWMTEYGVSHRNPTNQLIHKICVPLIMLSVIGLLWSIPTPEAFRGTPYLNWATIFIVGCLIFYITLSFMMFLGMLLMTFVMCWICVKLQQAGILLPSSIGIFVFAWIAQFYGHKVEGKKPSFMQDLAFLLIGPLWVLHFFYTKMGLKI
jgi:uncharacterized membrane protein YGL010W